jgi:hypothetical protein
MYELTEATGSHEELCESWPDGVLYNGQSIFEIVYNDHSFIGDTFADELCSQWQECYLGYVKDEDFFIVGFDTWPDSGETRNNIFRFELTATGRPRGVEVLGSNGRMFYSDKNLSTLHTAYPSLIDVRLD